MNKICLGEKIRFLIIGDLHGQMPNIYFKDFDAIIAPGDFCSDAPRKYMFQALKEYLANPKVKRREWYEICGKKKAKEMILKSMKDGRKILEKLNSYEVPVFVLPGNWDWTGDKTNSKNLLERDNWSILKRGLKNVYDLHKKGLDIGGYKFVGHGITSGPEFPQGKNKKNLSRKELIKKKKKYQKLFNFMSKFFKKSNKEIIFLTHNVPYNTTLDKIVNPESPRNGEHFGSFLARELIDKYQPLVCIGGHMHEHFGKTKVRRTTAINAGFGGNVNVLLELKEGKISTLKFHRIKN